MDKQEKVRKHIVVSPGDKLTFYTFFEIISEIVVKLEDELIAFSYIDEDGLVIGSENLYLDDVYLYNDTLFRAFTKKLRWRITAVRRTGSEYITFIELLAPYESLIKLDEVVVILLAKIGGTATSVM